MRSRTYSLWIVSVLGACGGRPTFDLVEVVERHPDGSVAATGSTLRGQKTGRWRYFHEAGYKEREVLYSADQPWFLTRYHSNGERAAQGDFVGGEKNGVWSYHEPDGQVAVVETYKQGRLVKRLDLLDERIVYFDESGQVRLVGTFRDGKEDGDYVAFYENGQKKEEGTYRDDKRDGASTYWNERGDIVRRELWRRGEQVR